MNLIKLDAIDSTNDFLKELSRKQILENFTTVVAKKQTKGKGQMGAIWDSEEGKNLIMSILIKDSLAGSSEIFDLNVAVSLAVITVLEAYNLPSLSVKWPNDIMSDNKKIAGVLIENSFKTDNKIESIVGIGLNVNQKDFSKLPKASSLSLIMEKEFDLNFLLNEIVSQIEHNTKRVMSKQTDVLWNNYHDCLFKKELPIAFEDLDKNKFMGIIKEVSKEGKILIMLEDDSLRSFGVKEIQMLY